MNNLLFYLFTGMLIALTACHTAENGSEQKADTTAVEAQSIVSDTNSILDPDPTDTVPGDRYLITSSSFQTAEVVRKTLQEMFKDDLAKNLIDGNSRKFIFFEFDLNNDTHNEILVGLTGMYFCGSGGCTQLILDANGKLLGRFTVAGNPVVIDTKVSNGWRDLFMYSEGKFHVMKHNGVAYPSNPSVQPILKLIPGDGLPRALDIDNQPYPSYRF